MRFKFRALWGARPCKGFLVVNIGYVYVWNNIVCQGLLGYSCFFFLSFFLILYISEQLASLVKDRLDSLYGGQILYIIACSTPTPQRSLRCTWTPGTAQCAHAKADEGKGPHHVISFLQ